jgi:hypothetical protein
MEPQGLVAKLTSSICTPFIAISEGRATALIKTADFDRCWVSESDPHGLYIDDESRSVCEEPRCKLHLLKLIFTVNTGRFAWKRD